MNRSKDWLDQAERDLEQARYPNGHAEGPPFAHYAPLQSGQAIEYADQILTTLERDAVWIFPGLDA